MSRLLRIDASGRGTDSVSRAVADSFEAAWLSRLPGSEVVTRDLAAHPVPHVPADLLPRSQGVPVTTPAARFQDELVDELLSADALLVSAPMYNLGVPSALKAWIDHVVLLGRTLPFPGDATPTAAMPATVVTAFGGGYGPGTPREGWDHVKPYLHSVFAGIFEMSLEFVTVELTLAETTPGMGHLTDLAERSLSDGHTQAAERAAQVATLVTAPAEQAS